MSDALFLQIKEDYITAYRWVLKQSGKPGIKIWKAKDNTAVGLLIKYIRAYHSDKNLSSGDVGKYARIWLNKASTTAPEWLRNEFEFNVLLSRFEVIMESPDPNSQAYVISKLQKEKYSNYKYNPKKHEVEPAFKQGTPSQLSSILKTIAEKTTE